jgi:hypothetical protein
MLAGSVRGDRTWRRRAELTYHILVGECANDPPLEIGGASGSGGKNLGFRAEKDRSCAASTASDAI